MLEQTKQGFIQWRELGKKRGEIPRTLKNQAVSLLDKHSVKIICNALNISSSSLWRWKNEAKGIAVTGTDFMELNTEDATDVSSRTPTGFSDTTTLPQPYCSALTLLLPHGLQLCLPEQPLAMTSKLIHTLIKEFA